MIAKLLSETHGNFEGPNREGCITSLLIAIQDFLVSGFKYQPIRFLFLTPET